MQALWNRLSPTLKREAALAFWRDGDPDVQGLALVELARRRRFREKSLARKPPEERARLMAGLGPPNADVLRELLQRFLLTRRPMLGRFLDLLGIPHDEGLIDDERDVPAPTPETTRQAVDRIRTEYPAEEVDLYLGFLPFTEPERWSALRLISGATTEPEDSAEEPAPAGGAAPDAPTFTTLDRILVRAVVESVSEIEGALDADEIEDLIEEAIQLNAERVSTWFHRGFLDGLKGREPTLDFPEANARRREWMLAGAIHAAARREEHDLVLKLRELRPAPRYGEPDGPFEAAEMPRLLFKAIVQTQRFSEFPRTLGSWDVLRGGPELWQSITWEAGGLLRGQRVEEAEPMLEAVASALESTGERRSDLLGDVRRRQAHCHRLRRRFVDAEAILRKLLEDPPPNRRSMILADLGLVRAGFRSLSDVRLPRSREAYAAFVEQLARGEEWFRRSAEEAPAQGGHGEYCLGVLELARGNCGDARGWLERAEAEMSRHAETYRELVLPRVRLYLGACLADAMDRTRAQHAADLVEEGVEKLREEALPLLNDALAGLQEAAPEIATALIRRLHSPLGHLLLDAADVRSLAKVPELRAALMERAGRRTRSARNRCRDWRTVLDAAMQAEDEDAGEKALDELEKHAVEGVGRDEFLALLDDPRFHGFVWTPEDCKVARAGLFERAGRLDDAAVILHDLAHEILTKRDRPAWLVEAMDLADQIKAWELPVDASLTQRIRANGEASSANGAPPARGRIAFVGGNETQRQYVDALRAEAGRSWPEVELSFFFPGWSSNWGPWLDRERREIEAADAVVLMRFVRTQCGRAIRKLCGEREIPWVACTAHGRAAMLRAIESAARLLTPARHQPARPESPSV